MSAAEAPEHASHVDGALTRDRLERKFALGRREARLVMRELDEHLSEHVHIAEGAEVLPGAQHFTTTVYFDTPSRDVLAQALSGHEHLKLRAREYYTFHPAFTQLATDPSQLVEYDPAVWLEIKARNADQVRKARIRVPKRQIPAFFNAGLISSEMVDLQRPTYGDAAQRTLQEIATLCRQFGEALRAVCVVNYQRLAWQDGEGTVRVTLDRDVAFYAAPVNLWEKSVALTRSALGQPVAVLPDCIVEVKATGRLPDWLSSLVGTMKKPPQAMSKFVLASRAIG